MNRLESFFVEIKKSRKSKKVATRQIIEFYGVTRRGWRVIERVNSWLAQHELIMESSFESANIYGSVKISPTPTIIHSNNKREVMHFPFSYLSYLIIYSFPHQLSFEPL